jgi:hypothetical protein
LEQQVLHTDVTGMPLEWIDYQQAVRLYYAREQVAYTCGIVLYTRCAAALTRAVANAA